MIIPLIMIKEPPSYLIIRDKDNNKIKKINKQSDVTVKKSFANFLDSLKVAFSNRNYI
jgi:hypothetical protein